MDFEVTYTEEMQRFRAEARAWLEANVPPGIDRRPASEEESYQVYLQRRELGRKLGERGWNYPLAPRQYGGGGLDVDHAIVLEEEADRLDMTLPPYYDSGGRLGSASILVWGTEEQKETFLPPIYSGGRGVPRSLQRRPRGPRWDGLRARVRPRTSHAHVAHAVPLPRRPQVAQAPDGRRPGLVTAAKRCSSRRGRAR